MDDGYVLADEPFVVSMKMNGAMQQRLNEIVKDTKNFILAQLSRSTLL